MVKATRHSAVLLGLLGVGLLISSTPGFAEVQNVRVGGDFTARAFHRENMDLNGGDDNGTQDRHDNFLMSTTGINVGADLTENISAFIRLANERDWNATGAEANTDFDISQAYITLKELFYSPLTLRVGTQPIVWGRGFVLGSSLIPGTVYNGADDRNAAISANEFTDFTAFDAIRATLDLSGVGGMSLPLTADYVYIKVDEGNSGLADDVNLQGVNFGLKFDEAHAEVEAYYLYKQDKNTVTPVAGTDKDGDVNTFGIRGSAKPVDGAYVYGELAYQNGRRARDPEAIVPDGTGLSAWAVDLGADYTLTSVAMTPKIGAEWIFFSGKDTGDGAVTGWDPLARGYFTTAIREFQTSASGAFYPTAQAGDTGGYSNQHQLSLYGSLKPIEDLTVAPRLSWFFLDEPAIQAIGGGNKRRSYAGTEWDTQVTYDYTDDVQFGFIYALFVPGTVYQHPNDNVAQELVTSVSVKF